MKPVMLVCLAVILYGMQNVVMEQKLARYNTLVILAIVYAVMLALVLVGLAIMRASGQEIAKPELAVVPVVVMAGVVWLLADGCYLAAYATGGSLPTITAIIVLFPATACAMRFYWVGGLPNGYQVVGYVLAAAAVMLVTYGAQQGQR